MICASCLKEFDRNLLIGGTPHGLLCPSCYQEWVEKVYTEEYRQALKMLEEKEALIDRERFHGYPV